MITASLRLMTSDLDCIDCIAVDMLCKIWAGSVVDGCGLIVAFVNCCALHIAAGVNRCGLSGVVINCGGMIARNSDGLTVGVTVWEDGTDAVVNGDDRTDAVVNGGGFNLGIFHGICLIVAVTGCEFIVEVVYVDIVINCEHVYMST